MLNTPKILGFRPSEWALHVFLWSLSLFFLYPLFYSVGVVFMNLYQFKTVPPGFLPVPAPWDFRNLEAIFENLVTYNSVAPLQIWMLNSVARVVWFIFWTGLSSLVMGFVFARMNFPGKNITFSLLFMTTLLPGVVTFTPTFIMMAHFPLFGGNDLFGNGGTGLFDSYASLLVLGMVNISMVFLVRMSIEGMTKSVEEAAIMDGAGLGTILFRIVLPMQQSIFAFIAIMTFMGIWADWFTPFVFNQSTDLQTIASGIVRKTSSLLSQRAQPNWPEIIGEGVILNIPCVVVFLAFQRNIVAGLTSSAVKG